MPPFGRNDHNAVGGTGAVDRGRRGVLQHRDGLDIARVDRIEIRTLDGHAVQNEERRGSRVDRVRSADLEHGRLARFARVGDDRQTGSLPLKCLVEGRCGSIRELFGFDRGHGTRD